MSWSISRHSFSSAERGFTLVEVLVAISILALLLTSVYGIFSSVSLARERLDADSAEYHRARVLFDRLGRELRGAYFRPSDRNLVFTGTATDDGALELELTTSAVSPLSQTGTGIAKVRYLLIEDRENPDAGRVLMRSEHPVLEQVDEEAAGMMRLVPGIEAMTLRFYTNGQWQAAWDGRTAGLPELVEIALQLHSGGTEPIHFVSAFELPEEGGR
ncbi:MAG: GspJ family type II secretion system protein [Desulfuromonadales bacterium]|jgi:general secretion pathway protein J|nr:GspJ family type II secretion system protein [Desulfuromonadales bacterium]